MPARPMCASANTSLGSNVDLGQPVERLAMSASLRISFSPSKRRTALITGGSSGIGLCIARALGLQGARIILVARRETRTRQDCQGSRAKTTSRSIDDLRRSGRRPRHSRRCRQRDRDRDGAGTRRRAGERRRHEPAPQSYQDVTAADFDLHMAVHLRAPFLLVQGLRRRAWRRTGHGAASSTSPPCNRYRAFANSAPYGAAKGGIVQLTRAMAEAWSPKGIMCNAIATRVFPNWFDGEAVFADEALGHAVTRNQTMPSGRNGRHRRPPRRRDLPGVRCLRLCHRPDPCRSTAATPRDEGPEQPMKALIYTGPNSLVYRERTRCPEGSQAMRATRQASMPSVSAAPTCMPITGSTTGGQRTAHPRPRGRRARSSRARRAGERVSDQSRWSPAGTCRFCREGRTRTSVARGRSYRCRRDPGAFAEILRIPDRNVVTIPTVICRRRMPLSPSRSRSHGTLSGNGNSRAYEAPARRLQAWWSSVAGRSGWRRRSC